MEKSQIFISWSGEKSKEIAHALYKWLPEVLEHSNAWMSDTDILKGTDWKNVVKESLAESSIGVLCLTSENLCRPWILFEAGALALNQKSTLVIPYLIDLTSKEIDPPLDQFNAALANKEETKKLVESINKTLGEFALEDYKIRVLFNHSWPKLQKVLKKVTSDSKDKESEGQSRAPIQTEIETLSRGTQPRRKAEKDLKKSQELQTRHMKQYGFKAERSISSLKVLDLKGTCKLRRSFEGIRVRAGFKIESLPGALALGNPKSRFVSYPMLKTVEFIRPLSLVFQTKRSNECNFQVKIDGDLTSGDPELSFAYESKATNGLLMTREEVEKAYKNDPFKYEYSCAEVDIPLNELTVEVVFPGSFTVEPHPAVFSRGGEILDELELKRIVSGFHREKNLAKLVVTNPLVEYTYLIYWLPPAAKDLAPKRKNANKHTIRQ